ncbi:MAG: hypothetical protein ABI661_04720 [Gammaproteobacteria bacterium]
MNGYTIALYTHLLVVVYLLGADLGRLLLARTALAGNTPVAALQTVARTVTALGSVTSAALILLLPAGVSLAAAMGVYRISNPSWLIATWLVATAWLADGLARFVIGAGHLYDGAAAECLRAALRQLPLPVLTSWALILVAA